MIGAKAARILTEHAHYEDIIKIEAIDWVETNCHFQIKCAAERGEDSFTFFVPKRYLSYVNDYLVNNLGYHFYALGRNRYDETQVKVRISWQKGK